MKWLASAFLNESTSLIFTVLWCCIQTPLCLAVITNQPVLVEKLLLLGSDVNTQIITERGHQIPSKRDQPLHVAASKGLKWLDTLRVLLQSQHVDIDVFNSEGLLSSFRLFPDAGYF